MELLAKVYNSRCRLCLRFDVTGCSVTYLCETSFARLCFVLQRIRLRRGPAQDRIEESIHVRRERSSLSAPAAVHPRLLRPRVATTDGSWKRALSAHALRKILKQ